MKEIAVRLFLLRTACQIYRTDAENLLGMSGGRLGRIETGREHITNEDLAKAAKLYRVDLGDLLRGVAL